MAMSYQLNRAAAPPPPLPFPVSSSSFVQPRDTALSSNILDVNRLVDTSLPPPRTHFRAPSGDSAISQHTNPFRSPNHTPHPSNASSSHPILSPVSPIEEEDYHQQSRIAPLQFTGLPHSTTRMSEPRKSVNLRQLDGKPYPGYEEESEPKSRKVKVAQDMFPGEMPPGYDRQNYDGPLASKTGHSGDCHKCGGHKKDSSVSKPAERMSSAVQSSLPPPPPQQQQQQLKSQSQAQQPQAMPNGDCNKCGGTKPRTVPPSSYPTAAMALVQPKSQPIPRAFPIVDSVAGPSSAPHGHRHKCGKCGRHKHPESTSSGGSSSQPLPPQNPAFGASYQHRNVPSIQTNGIPFSMNIEPPSAVTERAPTLPFSPASVTERPLIEPVDPSQRQQKDKKLSHGNSISSLFRSLSKRGSRRSSHKVQLPSQKLANGGEQNPDQLIDKISHAIRDGEAPLGLSTQIQRSPSTFSFVSKSQEDQTFEMRDMQGRRSNSRTPDRRNSWDKADEATMFLEERPKFQRSQSTSHKLGSKSVGGIDDLYLGANPEARPQITRFKSLRVGVNKAANGLSRSASQISRSTSLRRLESVKKVPQFWYREDMVIEGAEGSEYVVNVY